MPSKKLFNSYQNKESFSSLFIFYSRLTPELILKHLHVQNFSISGTIDRLRDLQTFYYSPITKLNSKTVENLKKGFVYTFGYSKNYRPIVIVRVDRIKNDMDI